MCTRITVAESDRISYAAGEELARKSLSQINGDDRPTLGILFASTAHQYKELLQGLRQNLEHDVPIMGCSTAGELSGRGARDSTAVFMLISSDEMSVKLGSASGMDHQPGEAFGRVARQFQRGADFDAHEYPFRTVLLLADGLAHTDESILSVFGQNGLSVAGGSAGDDGSYQETFVFHNDRIYRHGVVAAEIYSYKPVGIGVEHGWRASEWRCEATHAQGNVLWEIDGQPAVETFRRFAEVTGESIEDENWDRFLATHPIGILQPDGRIKVRTARSVGTDGGILLTKPVATGAKITLLSAEPGQLVGAAREATRTAVDALDGADCAGILAIDGHQRKQRLGEDFQREVEVMLESAGNVPLAGFNSYGEISQVPGQLNGMHDTTDVVVAFPA